MKNKKNEKDKNNENDKEEMTEKTPCVCGEMVSIYLEKCPNCGFCLVCEA